VEEVGQDDQAAAANGGGDVVDEGEQDGDEERPVFRNEQGLSRLIVSNWRSLLLFTTKDTP